MKEEENQVMRCERLQLSFIILLLFITGCAAADLRPATLAKSGLRAAETQKSMNIMNDTIRTMDPDRQWKGLVEWEIQTIDEWPSGFLRSLTPVRESGQLLQFSINLQNGATEMEYLNGPGTGERVGISGTRSYRIKFGQKFMVKENRIDLYLPPVRDYFLWPLKLKDFPVLAYAGESNIDGVNYVKIFAGEGAVSNQLRNDHHIVWINQDTNQIDFIEFTMRRLYPAYRGVVEYHDYRNVQGMWLPHKIILKDQLGAEEYSHRFLIQKMTLR